MIKCKKCGKIIDTSFHESEALCLECQRKLFEKYGEGDKVLEFFLGRGVNESCLKF